jgi:broad-specificity NMP kinase
MPTEIVYPQLPNNADLRRILEPLRGGPSVIIEIMGTPNAGKTTALRKLASLLKRSGGCRVSAIYESASACSIRTKYNPAYCEWIACETMQRLLEQMDQGAELILCERGLVDVQCWRRLYLKERMLSQKRYDASLQYSLESVPFAALRLVVVFTCEPSAAVAREYAGSLSVPPGQIVNVPVLTAYNRAIADVLEQHGDLLPPYVILDTTRQTMEETAEALVAVVGDVR